MLLKIEATGRRWGNKAEPIVTPATIGGVKCIVTQSDVWEGPVHPGDEGRYFRCTTVNVVGKVRDDRLRAKESDHAE